jgi:hypothetical protein
LKEGGHDFTFQVAATNLEIEFLQTKGWLPPWKEVPILNSFHISLWEEENEK